MQISEQYNFMCYKSGDFYIGVCTEFPHLSSLKNTHAEAYDSIIQLVTDELNITEKDQASLA